MKDLVLAHGYFLGDDAQERRIMRPHPPLGLLYLSGYLKARGVDVGLFDSTFQTLADFEDCLRREKPAVVGLAANLMTKPTVLRMMTAARRAGARVVVGGPDPPHYASEYIAHGADVVVIGEGEQTLEALLPPLMAGDRDQLGDVAGIAFAVSGASAGTIVRTRSRALLSDLDALPLPDRDAVDVERYLAAWRARHGFGAMSLITARGCPYTCTWCSRSVFGTTHRRRTPANVADEVEYLHARYRPDRLWYADDVFAIHRSWTLAYAAELRRRRLRLPFECISRAERIDEDVADALHDLGCWRVWIGSESGSQSVLDRMERRTDVERVVQTTRRLQRRGIEVGMFIMLGYDGESAADLQATVDHLKRAAPDVCLTTVSYPIKGTAYYESVRERIEEPGSPWAEHTDRDLTIGGRPGPRYYQFARRWVAAEVATHAHWRQGRYVKATRAAASALVGRVGMRVTSRRTHEALHTPVPGAGR